jgi:proton-dependent oligopeptide transporter, POT family
MANSQYLTAPIKTDKMPPGVPYIIGNEAAERFSFYGMKGILVVFMTTYLMNAQGELSVMPKDQAQGWYHTFVSAVYFLPILGALLADALLGKYRTILILSVVYCLGHFALAINDTRIGLAIGLGLVALGSGGIKPCVSANVGDQFGSANQHLLTKVFNWFYFSINFGSAGSTMLMPWLLANPKFGPKWAFGVPGIAMVIATIIFWMGRKKFVHIPPMGLGNFVRQFKDREVLKALGNLLIPIPFAAMFWSLWDQTSSSWIKQCEQLDLHIFGRPWLPAQIQTVNPIFILLALPLFSYVIYPLISKVFPLTPLRKIGLGLFAAVVSFWIVAWTQGRIDAGEKPTVYWQILAFIWITAAEVMISVPHLEFAYTQAPKSMKSLVMCTYLSAISVGNMFTAAVNFLIGNADGTSKLSGAAYFYFFVWVMLGTAVIFVFVSPFYRGKTYIQDDAETKTS